MPVLKYFAVVGSVLLGLLLVAGAVMPKPEHPVFASKFDQTPPAWHAGRSGVQILRAVEAPAPPHIAEIPAVAVEDPAITPAPVEIAKVATKKKKALSAHRRTRTQPPTDPDPWNAFAYAPSNRNSYRQQQPFWFR